MATKRDELYDNFLDIVRESIRLDNSVVRVLSPHFSKLLIGDLHRIELGRLE